MNDELKSNAIERDAPAEPFWQSPGFWLICGLLVIAAQGNFIGTWLLWDHWEESLMSSAVGLLAAEICLFGIWVALGSQTLLLRVCLSLGAMFALTCLYLVGVHSFNKSRMPGEVQLIILGIPFVLVGLTCFPLGLIRWRSKCVVSRKVIEQDIETSEFGIRHLLTVTAVAAVLVVLAQNAFPKANFEGGAPWLDFLRFLAIYMLLSCLICLLSLAAIFDGKRRRLNFILLIAAVAIGSVVASLILCSFGPFQNYLGDTIFNSIVYSGSMAIGLVTVLAAFYATGFRFRKT